MHYLAWLMFIVILGFTIKNSTKPMKVTPCILFWLSTIYLAYYYFGL